MSQGCVPHPRLLGLPLFALMAALLVAFFPAKVLAAEQKPRVLLVQSYSKDHPWCQKVEEGLREALKATGATIETFYMDAKRQGAPAQLEQKGQEARRHIERTRPQVVVAADDAAQQYLVAPHLKGRDKPQVIFCGVNAPPAQYGFPAANVSGVRERTYGREALSLLKQIAPELLNATLLTDASETSDYVLETLREDQRKNGPLALPLKKIAKVGTFQEWQRQVQLAQSRGNALVLLLYHTLLDERTGQVATPEEVIKWTLAANKRPTAGLFDFSAGHGVLCGVLESGLEQGFLAGNMAREVLAGAPAGKLPIRQNNRGVVFVNLQAAQRLGIVVPYVVIEAAGLVAR